MINLMICELQKIFHKKSIYIVWGLLLAFCFLNNVLYKLDYDEEGYYIKDYQKDNTKEIKELEEKISLYNKEDVKDATMYVELKTKLDLLKLQNNYPKKSWQYKNIDYLKEDVYYMNYYTYVEKEDSKLQEYTENYKDKMNKLNQNQWQYFTNLEIDSLKASILEEQELLESVQDKLEQADTKQKIKLMQKELETLELRIKKDIPDGMNYLNDALISYMEDKSLIDNRKNTNDLDYDEKVKYNDILTRFHINYYIIDNHVNLNQENNLNYLLRTIVEDYELFIILIILLISGSIMSEEFQKGTIKLLLIKPSSRSKILLSKYFSSIMILLITFILVIVLELMIGGYLFGIDSLKMKVACYDFSTSQIKTYSIFGYMFLRILYHFPFFIMILTICFCISIISCNTTLSVTLTMFLYLFSNVINDLILKRNLSFLKYTLTLNWDFLSYMFGGSGISEHGSLLFSGIVYTGYLLLFLFISWIVFQRKNIRNI